MAVLLFPTELLTVESGPVHAELIVVLGGSFEGRAERAAALFNLGEAPQVLVSGFGDTEKYSAILIKNGVPPSQISLEGNSKSTLQNAQFSIRMIRRMGVSHVIIVTSWYHSRRALACFEHCAPDIHFYSRPSYVGYSWEDRAGHNQSAHVASEFLKVMGYWIIYGIWPFPLK